VRISHIPEYLYTYFNSVDFLFGWFIKNHFDEGAEGHL
jgi:hypothetical protein